MPQPQIPRHPIHSEIRKRYSIENRQFSSRSIPVKPSKTKNQNSSKTTSLAATSKVKNVLEICITVWEAFVIYYIDNTGVKVPYEWHVYPLRKGTVLILENCF